MGHVPPPKKWARVARRDGALDEVRRVQKKVAGSVTVGNLQGTAAVAINQQLVPVVEAVAVLLFGLPNVSATHAARNTLVEEMKAMANPAVRMLLQLARLTHFCIKCTCGGWE